MQLYLAPMEGLTGYIYRNAYARNYGGIDWYFTPFLSNKKLSSKEINDILPEHNAGMQVVPQILTNRAENFLRIAETLQEYGYRTVNLNLGCPSGTVVAKKRGAGFLAVPEELERFLDEIFEKCPLEISVKTRIGVEEPKEWERLLALYEKYPFTELIIHPRVQREFYKGKVHTEAFALAEAHSGHRLCYNGDICTVSDYQRLTAQFPRINRVMIGRGILKHPSLAEAILARQNADGFVQRTEMEEKKRFRIYHDMILQGYQEVMSGDKNTLFKMKELWVYFAECFEQPEAYLKKIRKCSHIREYEAAVDGLFADCRFRV